jgi:N-acetyl sugar amidotransferase
VVRYCTQCVYPSSSAVPLQFDDNGVCSGCRVAAQRKTINWEERGQWFMELADEYRTNGSNYDCIIPVSGGKDSWYQTYYVTQVLKLHPLLVTYNGNNYLEVGLRNLKKMREVFGVDHLFFSPSVPLLKKMNRLCMTKMGDMNWHAHCGIFTYPIQIAVKHKIPLLVWGEHGFADLGGMFSMNDLVEFTAKHRLEHSLRGFDWYDMMDEEEGIQERDLLWAKYPTDDEIESVEVRGVYMGNFVDWDANHHGKKMIEDFGFEPSPEPFERTYRTLSNLDDMHENGMHDYLKFIKFGYGRASDHVCKDIRSGILTREEGIELVRRYDHVKSKDLLRWLDYTGWSEDQFDAVCDTFRDPRVWTQNSDGEWEKENIWGGRSAYPVDKLTRKSIHLGMYACEPVPR